MSCCLRLLCVRFLGRDGLVVPLDEDRARPRGIATLGQLAQAELGHGLALDSPEDRRRDVRVVGRIVLADLDPQLAGDHLVDHLGEPAQPARDQRRAGHQQPGKRDVRTPVAPSHAAQAPRARRPARRASLASSSAAEPRYQSTTSAPALRPANVATRPAFLHVRGVEVIDAQALRNAHHAAPSCPPGVGRQVGVQASPHREI